MECDDLSQRVSLELKSVGIEDCVVITKTVWQQSRRQPTFFFQTKPSRSRHAYRAVYA